MATKKTSKKKPPSEKGEIAIDYVKANFFRVVHADGVWGGLTPHGDIHMDFWSERFPIPRHMVHRISEGGTVGEEIREEREQRQGLVREVEVAVVMGVSEAIAFRDWLNAKIEQAEDVAKQLSERQLQGEPTDAAS